MFRSKRGVSSWIRKRLTYIRVYFSLEACPWKSYVPSPLPPCSSKWPEIWQHQDRCSNFTLCCLRSGGCHGHCAKPDFTMPWNMDFFSACTSWLPASHVKSAVQFACALGSGFTFSADCVFSVYAKYVWIQLCPVSRINWGHCSKRSSLRAGNWEVLIS